MKKAEDFTHLHTHSDCSKLDGLGKIDEYVKVAESRGHKAIAFTDHGTMRGYMQLHEATQDCTVKPIYGIEFYVSPNMRRAGLTEAEKAEVTKGVAKSDQRALLKDYEERQGIRDRWHLTVWANSDEGLRNLYRLSSAAWIDGFYYKPRIDLEELFRYGNGLEVASGCLSSPINDSLFSGKKKQAFEYSDRLQEFFGDRYWLELQPHAIREQRDANQFALTLHERYKKRNRFLATQDAHYVRQEDAPHHEVLLCIGTGTQLSSPDRFKFDGDEFFMKTRSQMKSAFQRNHEFLPSQALKEAMDSTIILAERCNAKVHVDYKAVLLPDPGVPEKYKDGFDWLKHLCLDGWAWRLIADRARTYAARHMIPLTEAYEMYRHRLRYELQAIAKQGFTPYFLIVYDIYRFAREQRIMVGPGRGSVGGSLVAYLIGVTSVDPIEHGLLFERFINLDRIDMPDIDMDFEDRRRHEIIEYIRHRYGADRVCQIATLGKLSGKQCLRDVARVLEVPRKEVDQVTNSIIERSSGDERASQTIMDSFKEFKVCREFDAKYPDVLKYATRLEGMVKNLGIHAAGVVASPVPLTDLMPLEVRNSGGEKVVVSAVDMYGVAAAGLVKLDVLGLRTLTVLKECLEMIEKRHGRHIDLESPLDVNLNDPAVLEGFTKHDYGGVFQYDTPSADKVCAGVNFTSFEDVAAMTALNRPGTSRSGLAAKYVERKKNPKLVEKVDFHPLVSKITSDTLGIIVYQEHVNRIFIEIAGFPPSTADSLRKVIAKKIGDETLGKERENFVAGAAKNGVDAKTANKIMDAITFFGSYGFNKSHATEYAMIAFWGMWLKTYYKIEFYWALMKSEPDRLRIQQIAKDAKKSNIELLPPHVNISDWAFAIDSARNAIRGSLVDIKGVGKKAAEAIVEARPFTGLIDMVRRVNRRHVHRGVISALASAGALEGLLPNTKHFVENLDEWWKQLTAKKLNAAKLKDLLSAAKATPDYDKEELMLLQSAFNPLAFGKHPIDAYSSFLKRHLKVSLTEMGGEGVEETFFKDHDGKGLFIGGVMVEVKYNQIGDFHTGALPSEAARKREFWGARYSNVNLEDITGKQNRFKFDHHMFPDYRHIVDKGVGTTVIVLATPMAFTDTFKAHFAVDLATLRMKTKTEEKLNVWEAIVTGKHPAKVYDWSNESVARSRTHNDAFWRSSIGGHYCGVITHVREKYDKKGGLMAFFGVLSADGRFIEAMCFASTWVAAKRYISTGRLMRLEIEKRPDRRSGGGWAYFYNGGKAKAYKSAFPIK